MVAVSLSIEGDIEILSNDEDYAKKFFQKTFLDCPPSFGTIDTFDLNQEWVSDEGTKGRFAAHLDEAIGSDPSHNIPENIQESLDEAQKSLGIANYPSSVSMSRRTLEAVRKIWIQTIAQ